MKNISNTENKAYPMKFSKLILLLIFFNTLLFSKADLMYVGLYYEDVFTTKKEALIGAKLWNKQVKEINLDVILYDDLDKLIKDYENKKLFVILISPLSYYKYKNKIDLLTSDKWSLSRTENDFEQYYLIRNKKSKLSLKNIKNQKVLYKNDSAKHWIETKYYSVNKNKTLEFKKENKDKKLLIEIFFKKDILSLVKKDLYDTMKELNPQVDKQIEIIEKSKAIFPISIGFDRKNIDKKYEILLKKMHLYINSRDVDFEGLSYINVNRVFYVDDERLQELENLYTKYLKIKKIHK